MKPKLVYICSPYTANHVGGIVKTVTEEARYQLITAVAAALKVKYGNKYVFFLPITQSHAMKQFKPELGGSFEAWKSDDLFVVKEKADELWVIMMGGWNKSIGVNAEIACAQHNKKRVRFISPSEVLNETVTTF